jgi:hypothetical protein
MGVPIKASSIYSKPTLAYLEDRFRVNERLRAPDKHKLKNAIEWTLRKNPMSLADFLIQLKKERITGVVHRNKEGFVYGLTFIDHRSKSVFNGSDIGKTYSAAAIQQRIAKGGNQKENNIAVLLQKQNLGNSLLEKKEPPKKRMGNLSDTLQKDKSKSDNTIPKIGDLLELLLKSDKNDNRIPYELLRRKKKKRNPLL